MVNRLSINAEEMIIQSGIATWLVQMDASAVSQGDFFIFYSLLV